VLGRGLIWQAYLELTIGNSKWPIGGGEFLSSDGPQPGWQCLCCGGCNTVEYLNACCHNSMFFCWDRCTLGPVCFTCSFLQAWPFLWCCDRGRGNRMWGQKLRKVKETPSILARAPAGSSRCGSYMFLHHCPVNYPVLVGNGGMRAEKLCQHKLPELDLLGSMSLRTTIRKRTQFKGAPMRQLFLFF